MKRLALVLIAISVVAAGDLKLSQQAKTTPTGKHKAAAIEEPEFLATPSTGYSVSQEPLEVRALLGVPGATHYSEPFTLPENASAIQTTPGQRWLLLMRADGAASVWIPESGFERALPGVTGTQGLIAFSDEARSMAFYSKADTRLAVYTGLPGEPELTSELSTAVWPDDVTALAVTRNGSIVAGLTGSGDALVLAAQGAAMHRLLVEGVSSSALAFWGDTEHLVFLDAAGERVLGVEHPLQGTGAQEIAALGSAVRGTATIVTGAGASLLVIGGQAGRIVRIGAHSPGQPSGELTSLDVGAFSQTSASRGRGTLLLFGDDGAPRRIVVSSGEEAGIHFVPAVAPPAETTEGGQDR